jgi:formylglycine-generating enzyme required for sulfatase activity
MLVANQQRLQIVAPVACVLCVAVGCVLMPALARAQPRLALKYSGEQAVLILDGEPGTIYSIQYTENLSSANSWRDRALVRAEASGTSWIDPSAPSLGQRFYRAVRVQPPADTNLAFIQAGTFLMGSPTNEPGRLPNEGPQRILTIGSGFWMGKYLVTLGEYQLLMGTNPVFTGELRLPAPQVTWRDATNYCRVRTEQERTGEQIPANSAYRLPTEAEWEYACRASTSTAFSYGDDPGYTKLANYAWYRNGGAEMVHQVGQKLPNPWGLYDMHGNVWEWCEDFYSPYPGGPSDIRYHVFRGGSVLDSARFCRSASRTYDGVDYQYLKAFGFRVVLALQQP